MSKWSKRALLARIEEHEERLTELGTEVSRIEKLLRPVQATLQNAPMALFVDYGAPKPHGVIQVPVSDTEHDAIRLLALAARETVEDYIRKTVLADLKEAKP